MMAGPRMGRGDKAQVHKTGTITLKVFYSLVPGMESEARNLCRHNG